MGENVKEPNRIQGMVRSIDQYRNGDPKAVADGSYAQVLYALTDYKHDVLVLWDFAGAAGRKAEALQRENAELREALEPFADVADLVDSETEGVADGDEFQMHFHDCLMASWKLSLFRRARALLGGENAE